MAEMTATQKALFGVLNECYDLPYDRFIEIFPALEKLVAGSSPRPVIQSAPAASAPDESHEHLPVQHRDGKPPWCNVCRRTADGRLADDIPFGER